jgi:hypothetical protein
MTSTEPTDEREPKLDRLIAEWADFAEMYHDEIAEALFSGEPMPLWLRAEWVRRRERLTPYTDNPDDFGITDTRMPYDPPRPPARRSTSSRRECSSRGANGSGWRRRVCD